MGTASVPSRREPTSSIMRWSRFVRWALRSRTCVRSWRAARSRRTRNSSLAPSVRHHMQATRKPRTPIRAPGGRAKARRPLSRGGSFFGRILAVLVVCWLVVGTIIAPVIPGGWAAMALAMLALTGLPLAAFIRRQRRRETPGAFVRLFFYRPFWYSQLLVLFTGTAGIAGLLIGARSEEHTSELQSPCNI